MKQKWFVVSDYELDRLVKMAMLYQEGGELVESGLNSAEASACTRCSIM